jgi:hypothetical protein
MKALRLRCWVRWWRFQAAWVLGRRTVSSWWGVRVVVSPSSRVPAAWMTAVRGCSAGMVASVVASWWGSAVSQAVMVMCAPSAVRLVVSCWALGAWGPWRLMRWRCWTLWVVMRWCARSEPRVPVPPVISTVPVPKADPVPNAVPSPAASPAVCSAACAVAAGARRGTWIRPIRRASLWFVLGLGPLMAAARVSRWTPVDRPGRGGGIGRGSRTGRIGPGPRRERDEVGCRDRPFVRPSVRPSGGDGAPSVTITSRDPAQRSSASQDRSSSSTPWSTARTAEGMSSWASAGARMVTPTVGGSTASGASPASH